MTDISNQKKIALIQVWLGQIPEYFKYHFETIKNLDYIDFLFFTDQEIEQKSDNFKKIKLSVKDLQNLISDKLNLNLKFDDQYLYKVNDLKASYFYLFEDYIKEYSHVGFYDIDTLFGDIYKFIEPFLDEFDVISHGSTHIFKRTSGPFSIFKNKPDLIRAFDCELFYDCLSQKEVCAFEEDTFYENVLKNNFKCKIIENVCNFIEKNGFYSEFESEWNEGVLRINGEEKMINHFYYKNHISFEIKGNKIITNFKKKLLEDFYWVTYFSENYQNLADNLLESIKKFSNRKIIIFTINYEVDNEFRTKYNPEQFIFRTLNIEEGQKDHRGRDFNIISLKPSVCLESIKLFENHKFIYVDSDVYLTTNSDKLQKYIVELENYPIFNSHIHDTIFLSNIIENERWTDVLGLLLKKLNIKQQRLYPRRKTNLFIYDKNSDWFFNEQISIFNELIGNKERGILELHDEDSANAILVKKQLHNKLPLIDIEENYEINDNFFDNYSYHMTSISPNVILPKNKNEVYVFHGFKNVEDYDKIRENYCNGVLKKDDILIEYKNNTLLFKKNNFLSNKKIENTVDLIVRDQHNNEVFKLLEQYIFNFSLFYISDIFLNGGVYNLEIIENISRNVIYQNYFEIS